jgi:hypothetical protein
MYLYPLSKRGHMKSLLVFLALFVFSANFIQYQDANILDQKMCKDCD